MASLQGYHAACTMFCGALELIPSPENTPEVTLERRQAFIEGYQMALLDLSVVWESTTVWRLETPRPYFAEYVQALQDRQAQRLGLVAAAVGSGTLGSPEIALEKALAHAAGSTGWQAPVPEPSTSPLEAD